MSIVIWSWIWRSSWPTCKFRARRELANGSGNASFSSSPATNKYRNSQITISLNCSLSFSNWNPSKNQYNRSWSSKTAPQPAPTPSSPTSDTSCRPGLARRSGGSARDSSKITKRWRSSFCSYRSSTRCSDRMCIIRKNMNHSLHPRSGPLNSCRLLPKRLAVVLEIYPRNGARRDQKQAYRMIDQVPYPPNPEWTGLPAYTTPSPQATATSPSHPALPNHPFSLFSWENASWNWCWATVCCCWAVPTSLEFIEWVRQYCHSNSRKL